MRALLMALLLIQCATPITSQTSGTSKTFQTDDPEQAVQLALKQLTGHMLTKVHAKLARHGDACAVALTKIYGEKDLRQEDISHILLILRFSYEAPHIIQRESNKKPQTSLLLLKYLDTLSVDPESKRKVAETRKFVVDQTAKLNENK